MKVFFPLIKRQSRNCQILKDHQNVAITRTIWTIKPNLCFSEEEKALTVGMTEKAKEFMATDGKIYQAGISEGTKKYE